MPRSTRISAGSISRPIFGDRHRKAVRAQHPLYQALVIVVIFNVENDSGFRHMRLSASWACARAASSSSVRSATWRSRSE